MRVAITSVPEFNLLKVIQRNRRSTYAQLEEGTGLSKAKIRKYAKELMARGYVQMDKKARPHQIVYLSTPWSIPEPEVQGTLETTQEQIRYQEQIPRS